MIERPVVSGKAQLQIEDKRAIAIHIVGDLARVYMRGDKVPDAYTPEQLAALEVEQAAAEAAHLMERDALIALAAKLETKSASPEEVQECVRLMARRLI